MGGRGGQAPAGGAARQGRVLPGILAGDRTLTAHYSGDKNYAAQNSDSLPFTVAKRALDLTATGNADAPATYPQGSLGHD